MTEHFNRLTEAEAERLALLAEEAAEVIQVITKILRHGYESSHPDEENGRTNRNLLEEEMGDLAFAMGLVEANGDVRHRAVMDAHRDKAHRVGDYLHHQHPRANPKPKREGP